MVCIVLEVLYHLSRQYININIVHTTEIDVSANQIFPQPVSSDDECNYAPDSDIDSSSESADENDLFDWSVNGEEGQCDASEESDADDEFEINVKQSLVQWVVECNIPRCSVSNLLKRLHIDAQLSFLPLDSRTLMSSTRGKVKLVDMPPGKYQHFELILQPSFLTPLLPWSSLEN